MARTYAQRPVTKPNQLVLRLSNDHMRKIHEIIGMSGFDLKRTAAVERAIDELHEKMAANKGKRK